MTIETKSWREVHWDRLNALCNSIGTEAAIEEHRRRNRFWGRAHSLYITDGIARYYNINFLIMPPTSSVEVYLDGELQTSGYNEMTVDSVTHKSVIGIEFDSAPKKGQVVIIARKEVV